MYRQILQPVVQVTSGGVYPPRVMMMMADLGQKIKLNSSELEPWTLMLMMILSIVELVQHYNDDLIGGRDPIHLYTSGAYKQTPLRKPNTLTWRPSRRLAMLFSGWVRRKIFIKLMFIGVSSSSIISSNKCSLFLGAIYLSHQLANKKKYLVSNQSRGALRRANQLNLARQAPCTSSTR